MDQAKQKFGRFEVQREIGRGAMGIVYLALDPALQRPVAIKSLRLAGSEADLTPVQQRFMEEARSAARLNHPNIVTVYEVGQEGGNAYIAMEFLEGRELKQILLDDQPGLSFRDIAEIVEQIAEALDYAHTNAIVHRDIKPANIMLVRGNIPKVLDFGIAMPPTGTDDEALKFVGSPKYMSPEQVEGRAIDRRSDIFSLGAVMYEMLTRRAPFEGETLTSVVYQILHEMPPPPQSISGNTPRYLARIVAKALAKRPEERYQTAAEMAAELNRYAQRAQAKATINKRKTSADALPSFSPLDPGAPAANDALSRTIQLDPGEAARAAAKHSRQRRVAGYFATLSLAVAVAASVWMGFGGGNAAPRPRVEAAPPPSLANLSNTKTDSSPAAETPAAIPVPAPAAAPHAEAETAKPVEKSAKRVAKLAKPIEAPPPAPEPALPDPAKLLLAVSPWGEIYLDGAKIGVAPPLKELQTTAGRHRIEIRNGDAPPHVAEFDLAGHETKRIKYKFQ
ncbi:MAG: serine/threonine protein kinase [Burkholderiales bacterium]|nr:MAG: serine/threonine protein kinase [Burkholderiales bacterium]